MADSAATKNVFIDTEVFDCHQLALDAPSFRRLIRLAAEGDVRLLLTTVTEREIRAHIGQHAEKAYKQVETYRRILSTAREVITPEMHAALSGATAEQFHQSLLQAFDKFLADTKTTILSVDGVSPEAILKDYFECNPPFGEGDKKSEFPDAFAAAVLKDWAEQQGESIFIVSADKDWRRVCQEEPRFIHQGQLGELLEKFSDAEVVSFLREGFSGRLDEVKALLEEAARGDIYYFSGDGVEPEIEEADDVDITIDDFHIIEAEDGEATVSLACTLHYAVTVVDSDQNSGYTDPDDGDRRYVYRRKGSVEGDVELEAKVTLQYDPEDPAELTFEAVSFARHDVEVFFEDSDLTEYADEDDFDEGDFSYEP